MSLKGIARRSSRGACCAGAFVLLCCLLAQNALGLVEQEEQGYLLRSVWEMGFTRFDARCLQWIGMRAGIWFIVYMLMMRLENRFTVYLIIRQRNCMVLFVRMYAGCLCAVIIYFGLAMSVMAAWFAAAAQAGSFWQLLSCEGLWGIYVGECAGCLNFCLAVYFIYCLSGRAEASFLAVLACRLAWGFFVHGIQPEVWAEAAVNVVLSGIVLWLSARGFEGRTHCFCR